jgi:hypothetical protein
MKYGYARVSTDGQSVVAQAAAPLPVAPQTNSPTIASAIVCALAVLTLCVTTPSVFFVAIHQ